MKKFIIAALAASIVATLVMAAPIRTMTTAAGSSRTIATIIARSSGDPRSE